MGEGLELMKVTVIAKNMQLTDALREIVQKKISKLEKYFEGNVEARATLSVQKNRHIIEVTIPFNGVLLRGEEATSDMYKSLDLVEDKLERQIRKQKTRLSRKKGVSLRFAEVNNIELRPAEAEQGKLVRVKKFGVKPMDSEEAILQMDLLGHNFFVYQDADSSKVNVVYKRKDGDYGLLEPELI
jgi:putative sigma-54 modulation protein